MRILSTDEIKRAEALSFEKYFTEAELMKKAGDSCASKIIKLFGDALKGKCVSVVCGNGKNAGDGFVIASDLKDFGCDAQIVLADKAPQLAEPLMYFNCAVDKGVPCFSFGEAPLSSDLIVDCIFGIGFHGEAKEPFSSVFDAVNSSSATVVSIDTPSGTDASCGTVYRAIKADVTIAISTLKYCHVLPPANEYCGKTYVVDIGIPDDCFEQNSVQTITADFVKSCFTKRNVNSNKGQNGHQLNFCGSYDMPGAAVICAKAALKTGVGLLKCAFPKSIYPVMTSHLIQPVFLPMSENEQHTFSMGALNKIIDELDWADSIAIGCGIGNNDDTQVIVNQIIKESEVPVVLDADGINSVLTNIDVLKDSKAPVVLTPHPGEMARLVGESVAAVSSSRIEIAKAFAKEYSCVLVLKGANTVVTDGKSVFINTTGNPGMAMGGTGDMLTGMIASFIAQGINAFAAARCAVYIHGKCGDITAEEISVRGMTVEDMLDLLGALMSEYE